MPFCAAKAPGHACLSVAGHSFQADFWALGVTIYEMLTGKTPFATRGGGFATYRKVRRPQRSSLRANRTHTLRCVQVMKGVFECPDDMSPGAASLIRGLCTKDVSKRLGRLANGADDLRNHPWYTDAQFDWVSVLHPPASPLCRADFVSAAAAAAAVSGDAAALRARCEGRRGHLLFCGRGRLGRGGPVGMAERFAAD